ncbi:phage holin family protein [Nocardioides sp.]|uniref:phage holin family protein n=1 Tax=Nocardioides sp. TaxID=35761 RepID=UPI003D1086EF
MNRIHVGDVVRLLVSWFLSFLALLLTAELLPGFTFTSWLPLLVAAAVTGLVGMIVRPILVQVAATIGWIAVAIATIFGQALVMQLALTVVPGATFRHLWTAVAAAWIAAAFGTLLAWIVSAGTDDSFAATLLRTRPAKVADPEIDGVLFVQLDGVSFPVMQWVLQSGSMPTLRRWVDSGSHGVHEWTVQMPCTTPASQQAILQGHASGVPAFRWYDRELARVLVANRPDDAAIIESRASTGLGLLADDGVSISNLFTGDAPKAAMTMSRLEVSRGSRRTRVVFARFLLRPDGLSRSVSRTIAEAVRERFQAKRQHRQDMHPRVHRSWTFAGLRAFTNGLLRDLNTAVVAEEMMRGAKSIYVNYVDYDEVAHHAGGTRLESLIALTGLDNVLSVLERVAAGAARKYHIVLLSDHGHSTGEPFASRYGTSLSELCTELTHAPSTSLEDNVEGWGRVDSVIEDLGGGGTSGVQKAAARRMDRKLAPEESAPDVEFVVVGSGNLGLVFVPEPERLTLEELDRRWPALVSGLATHPGVGFVSVMSEGGPVAIGGAGRRHLATGVVEGEDPLVPFGDHAPAMLLSLTQMAQCPDILVNSAIDAGTQEVAAFEPLVGCHGGLGGWQDRGFVLAPPELFHPDHQIVGGDELHLHLIGILESLGHRKNLARSTP